MSKREIRKWSPRVVIYKKSFVDEEEYEIIIEELGHILYDYFRQLHLSQNPFKKSNSDASQ